MKDFIAIWSKARKVSKFQKQIFLFSFEQKTNEIIFVFLP